MQSTDRLAIESEGKAPQSMSTAYSSHQSQSFSGGGNGGDGGDEVGREGVGGRKCQERR